jgi:hypothetical protein
MDAPVVLAALEAAFPLEPLPSVSPHQAHLANQSMSRTISEEEWVAAGKPDAGRTWQQFTDDELMTCDAALAFFDEESFVYYLPAYLRFAINHCDVDALDVASSLTTSVVGSVTDRSLYSVGRYKKLSLAQRAAVISFLEFMAEHAGSFNAPLAQKALTRYWKTDEPDKPIIIVP